METENSRSKQFRHAMVQYDGRHNTDRTVVSNMPCEFLRSWRAAVKPWSDFFLLSNFSCPTCIEDYSGRLRRNLFNFFVNYTIITAIFIICSILTSFWLLLPAVILGFLFYIIYKSTKNGLIVLGESEIPRWLLCLIAIFFVIPLFMLSQTGYIIYVAVAVSAMLIWIHSSFFGPKLATIDEVDDCSNHIVEIKVTEPDGTVKDAKVFSSSNEINSEAETSLQTTDVTYE